jgi:hypothetical protein
MIGLALDKGEYCRVLQASHWLPRMYAYEPSPKWVVKLLEEDYKLGLINGNTLRLGGQ